jgi:hypothetical protein
VDVEILDVNDGEAKVLLLSIDRLAALAQTQEQLHQRLLELAPAVSPDLEAAWQSAAEAALEVAEVAPSGVDPTDAQYLVLITCRDEKHQVELLGRFHDEGLDCKALLS